MAGSWLIASVCMLRMKHISSATLAVQGSISESHMPHLTCWANLYFDGAIGNRIQGNAIRTNSGLGIDLGDNGITPNDPGDADRGPNELQNFPVLAGALPGATTRVFGTLNSTANTTFTLDFYASPAFDPAGPDEGARYLGSAPVTTDASGAYYAPVMTVPAERKVPSPTPSRIETLLSL